MIILGKINIQYHRAPKYMGNYKTKAPSYIRVYYNNKFCFDIHVPKYGKID